MKVYNILDFGAKAEPNYNNSKHIQAAVDLCHKEGGGRVLVPSGQTFYMASLVLKSNVDFHVDNHATIIASKKLEEYTTFEALASKSLDLSETPTWENCEYNGRPSQFFIYAIDSENVTISGKGVIDGSEEIYYGNRLPGFIEGFYYPRIPMLFIEHVKNLTIKDITLTRSGFWTTHLVGCEDVLIEKVRILNSLELANCDGIDPDHCKRMTIKDCYIECADDAIVFKNTEAGNHYGPCEDIVVENCKLVSTSAGIKFGTESDHDFRNIKLSNIAITKASRGISFQLRDSGNIENISFENISIQNERHTPGLWWGTGEPIFISAIKRHETTNLGSIKNISFKNISATSENGIVIYGEDQNISDIKFDNVVLKIENQSEFLKEKLDLRPTIGSGIVDDQMHIIKIKDSKNIKFKNLITNVDDKIKNQMGEPYDFVNTTDIKI